MYVWSTLPFVCQVCGDDGGMCGSSHGGGSPPHGFVETSQQKGHQTEFALLCSSFGIYGLGHQSTGQVIGVSSFHAHPDYNYNINGSPYDIALLILSG